MTTSTLGTALITGASTGIGAVYASRLAKRGYDLVIVARNQERLQMQAQQLQESTGRSVQVIRADLTHPGDLYKVEEVLRSDRSITMLVNNAGIGSTTSILESDIDRMEQMLSLNINALTRLTYAAAPGFVERKNGIFINIASIVAIAPEVLNGIYGGSKAYVLAFSQSLKHELEDKGIQVQVVLPGATSTEFWEVAGTPVHLLPEDMVMTAEALVGAALAGLDNCEFVTIPALEDSGKWDTYESARQAMQPYLSSRLPASRYVIRQIEEVFNTTEDKHNQLVS